MEIHSISSYQWQSVCCVTVLGHTLTDIHHVTELCVSPDSSTMGEIELSCRAYVKMYLHACLFPRCSVNGLLLSSASPGGAVCVTDCVPLLHSHLSLAPVTQLALTQVHGRHCMDGCGWSFA